ncbi:hypothetical protein [Nocardia wallacei]|uniref:Lipopolysaccharide assembly protein A domain-containing protein n=1 Tax=Nocardia wallacei TaxID=480035 RepID=A0A7G1KIL2_9NOCA|nr:hypothetical protein [Nocardia wallacei]BCK54860.1 hypothetical protein NWFMUON74_26320 [Nocardia wallacei]
MDRTAKPSVASRMSAGQWLAVVLTVLAVVFIVENRNRVEIEFLLITIRSPMWLVLLVMFAVGWLAGMLVRRVRR